MVKRILKAFRERKLSFSQDDYAREVKEINESYARLFSTADGKIVLDHLVEKNLLTAIASQGDTMLDIGVKQGRSNIINEIIQRLNS